MQWGKRGPGTPSRRRAAFRPDSESLEERRLLTAIDLTTTQTAATGVEFVGKASDNTAGYTVTDVGNVTGSGYDSFVISATGLPGQSLNIGGKTLDFTAADESAVYLVFGSKAVNVNTVSSYLTLANGVAGTNGELTSGDRAGDLGELGTLGVAAQSGTTAPIDQTNPTVAQPQPPQDSTHVYGFNFDGLTFVTGLDSTTGLGRNSGLGFSVTALGDLNSDGYDDFALSAPNDAGGGKVFVIYGGPALATQAVTSKTVDLEPTAGTDSTTTPTKVVSFNLAAGTTGDDVGYSVAGIGNYFGNGSSTHDLAIGVPGLTVGGLADAGAVFTVSGTYINSLATGTNIALDTQVAVTSNTTGGIEYTGFSAGQEVGFSVSTAGNFDGATGTNGSAIDDLLIGAPGGGVGGEAFLVYGSQAYLPNQTIGSTYSLATLGTAPVTTPVQTYPLQGVIFVDQTIGDLFGFSVATAGDFNADGVDDIMIGAPGYLTSTGYVTVVYGLSGTATINTSTRLNGVFAVNPTVTSTLYSSASYIGQGIDAFTGYSIASSGHIQIGTATTTEPTYDILIGAPGDAFQTAYLVPGTGAGVTPATGTLMLANINTTLGGNSFNVSGTSDPAVITGNAGFATSVSARNLVVDPNSGTNTVDPDDVPDLFFGAPFASLNSPINIATTLRSLSGVAYVVEGSLIGGTSSSGGTGTSGGTTSSATVTTSFNTIVNSLNPVVFTGDDSGLPNPPLSQLSHLDSYAPLSVPLAEQQFRPTPGFLAREDVYHHPSQKGGSHSAPAGTVLDVAAIRGSENQYSKVNTLRPGVFKRGKTVVGKKTTFTHKVKVIPENLQTETYPG
jgi:hypothetical protein